MVDTKKPAQVGKLGIQKTLEVFQDLGDLAAAGIGLVKGGVGLGSIGKIVEVAKDISELIKDVPGALPELTELDAAEASQIGEAAFALVKKVIEAVK